MNNETGIQRANGGGAITAREDAMSRSMERVEAGVSVLQTAATAEVQARYIMAFQRPRDYDDARVKLLRACRRGGFAEQALYAKPIGGGKTAEGLSIRFAEEAERAWGNLHVSKMSITDEPDREVWRVYCVDLENNVTESEDVTIEKVVEQTFMRDGQPPLSMRLNSYNKPVYLYPADEGRLITKRRAALSKAKRAVVLANIPGEIQDECKAEIRRTRAEGDRDPNAARKKIVDAFSTINVMPSQLADLLGHPIEQVTPAEMEELRGYYAGIKSGDIESWADLVASKKSEDETPAKADASTTAAKRKVQERMKKAPSNPGVTPPDQNDRPDIE
jgi:hypothetical protein